MGAPAAARSTRRVLSYAGTILIDRRHFVALQERDAHPDIEHPGRITAFGGLLEGDETPRQGAVRELKEELGLDVTAGRLESLGKLLKEEALAITTCFMFFLEVPDVRLLTVLEGAGSTVGSLDSLLRDPRLTATCKAALEKLALARADLAE